MDFQYAAYNGGRPVGSHASEESFQRMSPAHRHHHQHHHQHQHQHQYQHPDDFIMLESSFHQQTRPPYTQFQSRSQTQTQTQTHWEQNFLNDTGPYVPSGIHSLQTAPLRCVEGVSPFPGRYSSPPSQSTCSSSMRSPRMESELVFPPTPQDSAVSPGQSQYDGSVYQYSDDTGITAGSGFGPSTIDPTWVHSSPQMDQPEQVMSDFGPGFDLIQSTRSSSLSSRASGHDAEVAASLHVRELLPSRMSPDDTILVEDEIVAHSYPEPVHGQNYEPMDEDDEYHAPNKDDDSDYTPKMKPRSAKTRRSHNTDTGRKRSTEMRSPRGAKKARPSPGSARAHSSSALTKAFSCTSCQNEFPNNDSLQKHMKSTHARPFHCVFGFAGCRSTFASKNEWKRHVLSQHVLLLYWICTESTCVDAYKESRGAIFNRKDLYTQHVRRMHTPQNFRKAPKTRKTIPEWDEQLRLMQEQALRHRCQLPTFLQCPAAECNMEFNGTNAWDDRMEHVARHLEKAAAGDEPEVMFGGEADPTLNQWAASPEVGIIRRVGDDDKWVLATPLKTTSQGAGARSSRNGQNDDSEDGQWESE